MNTKRLIIYLGVFVLASAFFVFVLNKYAPRGKAASTPVSVFFEKETIQMTQVSTPVNILLQVDPSKKISGASVQLLYPPTALEVDMARQGTLDATCIANGGLLTTQAKFENDTTKGLITISNVKIDSTDANLPPTTPSGIFCMTTVYFKFKPTTAINQSQLTGTVSFNTDPVACEIVGPNQTYSCTFPTGAGAKVVISGQATPTHSEKDLCALDLRCTWKQFPNSCADKCSSKTSGVVCAEVITDSGECGSNYCWNGSSCQLEGGTTITPPVGSCPKKAQGDCDCNGDIAIADFEMWRKEYLKETVTQKCDFNLDLNLTLSDFNIWRSGYFSNALNF